MSIQTRNMTSRILNEERMIQEEIERVKHYKLLESTYEADHQIYCDTEAQIYEEIKPLESEITVLYSKITEANKAYHERSYIIGHQEPFDEVAYEALLVILTNIEMPLYERVNQLNEEISVLVAKLINVRYEFERKYNRYS